MKLVEHFQYGLNSPICLTWELTYACNLACVHCLSSSGRRDPRELSTDECKAVVDELQRMQVFYVNIGGGEPTVRPDFWELLDYAISHDVGVKFSTNGIKLDKRRAAHLAATDYVDIQISLDGATAEVNDHVRGPGSYATAIRALENLAEAGFGQPKISVVMTRQNVDQLDEFRRSPTSSARNCGSPGCGPRAGRGRLGRAAPAAVAAKQLYDWLVARGEGADRRLVLPPVGLRQACD
jgi:mycofactocin radical SAM maturase